MKKDCRIRRKLWASGSSSWIRKTRFTPKQQINYVWLGSCKWHQLELKTRDVKIKVHPLNSFQIMELLLDSLIFLYSWVVIGSLDLSSPFLTCHLLCFYPHYKAKSKIANHELNYCHSDELQVDCVIIEHFLLLIKTLIYNNLCTHFARQCQWIHTLK